MRVIIFHRPTGPHGGDVSVAKDFAAKLAEYGIEAEAMGADQRPDTLDYAHIWAACSPDWGLPLAQWLHSRRVHFTLTPEWYPRDIRQAFYGRTGDITPGYTPSVAMLMQMSDKLACVNMSELMACWKLAPRHPGFVMGEALPDKMPAPRRIEGLPDQYVLCVGRIEAHKNQAMLAMACAWLGLPLLCIGPIKDKEYAQQVAAMGGKILGFIDDPALVAGYMAQATVHALPSLGEIQGMANMEALYYGTPTVISTTNHGWEYFQDRVNYCDPTDWRDIAAAIVEAAGRERTPWKDQTTWDDVVKKWIENVK